MTQSDHSDRLFEPRVDKFCPGQHCAKACDAAKFCRDRKRASRGQIAQQIAASPNRQLHLPTGRTWK